MMYHVPEKSGLDVEAAIQIPWDWDKVNLKSKGHAGKQSNHRTEHQETISCGGFWGVSDKKAEGHAGTRTQNLLFHSSSAVTRQCRVWFAEDKRVIQVVYACIVYATRPQGRLMGGFEINLMFVTTEFGGRPCHAISYLGKSFGAKDRFGLHFQRPLLYGREQGYTTRMLGLIKAEQTGE